MGEVGMSHVKSEPESDTALFRHDESHRSNQASPLSEAWPKAHEPRDNHSSNPLSSRQSTSSVLESPAQATSLSVPSPVCPAPICRQFWKAGNYIDISSISRVQNSQNYIHVHPKFLHSNATSHKWAFGAIAELLDNAIDEIQNGATFAIVDKIPNPRDGSPALMIQDDGGGMDPQAIRHCMSFGFSDKKSKSAIGRYGNGFKTSTMRLGADVIVFSRQMGNGTLTQSIGLLSYTYLSRAGLDRIVVPMIDYKYNESTATFEPVHHYGKDHFQSNISIFLQWSPYSGEVELLKQLDDIGSHGTKVIIYNLWFTNDGILEFDFESNPEDVRLPGSTMSEKVHGRMLESEEHIANQYHCSLRVYLSILYLRIPQNYCIILRGKVVEHHNIAHNLKYPEFILYKPQTGGTKEGEVLTTIGFLKEAPHVHIHGFNIYHKNRLVLPFWPVVSTTNSKGRGVVGVLEANFVEPIHNKQDFERTSLFQKLETRLKEMTYEYWDYHCGLIGYHVIKKTRVPVSSPNTSYHSPNKERHQSPSTNLRPDPRSCAPAELVVQKSESSTQYHGVTNRQDDIPLALRTRKQFMKGQTAVGAGRSIEIQSATCTAWPLNAQEAVMKNKKLRAECLQHKKNEEELSHKLLQLSRELEEARLEYARMYNELQLFDAVKPDT